MLPIKFRYFGRATCVHGVYSIYLNYIAAFEWIERNAMALKIADCRLQLPLLVFCVERIKNLHLSEMSICA